MRRCGSDKRANMCALGFLAITEANLSGLHISGVTFRVIDGVTFRGIVSKSLDDEAFLVAILSARASAIDPLDQQTMAA
jgi:hypothetical protein